VQVGTNEAYLLLEQALKNGAKHTRDAIMQGLGGFRDEKSAPLYLHILAHTDYKGQNEGIYTQTIEYLGKVASDDRSVSVLTEILMRGEWWARGRTARIRTAAARALRSMGTSGADSALEVAASSGPRAVRKIAKAALAEPAAPRRRKDPSVPEDVK
jgi:HEAT repeat protein